MNQAMNRIIRISMAVAIALGIGNAPGIGNAHSFVQGSSQEEVVSAPADDLSHEEKLETYKVDLSISEPIQLTDYVELLQEQTPTQLNILISKDAGSIEIPPMNLSQVSVYSAIYAVDVATGGQLDYTSEVDLIVISRLANRASDETVKVVNVASILVDTDEASLLSAIEIALGMRNSSTKNVTIRLHQETRLLFVKGVSADIDIVMQIVSQLGGQPWPPQQSGSVGDDQPAAGASNGGGGQFGGDGGGDRGFGRNRGGGGGVF